MADWDDFSKHYDGIFLENPHYLDTIRMTVDELAAGPGKRVMDLGCGTGNLVSEITRRLPDALVAGVDPSEGMRAHCAAKFEDNDKVSIHEGSAVSLPFGDGEFDCLTTNLALHHVPPENRRVCASELSRVLAEGGSLVFADMFCDVDAPPGDPARTRDIIDKMVAVALYCLDNGAYEMMLIILKTLHLDVTAQGEYLTTDGVWADILREAGFVDIEVIPVPPGEFGVRIIRADLP